MDDLVQRVALAEWGLLFSYVGTCIWLVVLGAWAGSLIVRSLPVE